MRLVDARRLTGRNWLTTLPGIGAELLFSPEVSYPSFFQRLEAACHRRFTALGLRFGPMRHRRHRSGMSIAMEGPIDALYTGVDVLEAAFAEVYLADFGTLPTEPGAPLSDRELSEAYAREASPDLRALLDACHQADIPMLWDDDLVSVGLGASARHFPAAAPPRLGDIDLPSSSRIPVAMITGSNGKTTTTRLLARMAMEAGLSPGYSSTEGLYVGNRCIDAGDWSGPGGARQVLRRPDVEVALLETARGGLLRRGLAVEPLDVAVITNVSEDHFGEYGVHSIDDMAEVKTLLGHAVKPSGRVILQGDQPVLHRFIGTFPAPTVLFSANGLNAALRDHLQGGGEAWYFAQNELVYARGPGVHETWMAASSISLLLGGTAHFQRENVLAAAAGAHALGLPRDAIVRTLRDFGTSPSDNPGRMQLRERDGIRLLLDFAHNEAGIDAVLAFIAALRQGDTGDGKLWVVTGHAGERTETEIRAVIRSIVAGGADRLIVRDLEGYLRGRAPGEVPAMMKAAAMALGFPEQAIEIAENDVTALQRVLAQAIAGDTIAFLAQVDPEGIAEHLHRAGWP